MLLAAAQFFATPFDLGRNLDVAGQLVRHAAKNGATLVVLPAMFNTGCVYSVRLMASAEPEQGPTLCRLQELSRELGICVAGALLIREQRRIFNTLVVVEPGGSVVRYRGQRPLLWERCCVEAGKAPVIAETPVGRLGLMTGWDVAEPAVWEAYAGRVDMLVIASAAPRLHRAVLNLPGGRKVYLAQLMPGLVRQRDVCDNVFSKDIAANAARLGVPVIYAGMAGRLVTELPFPRLSILAAALKRPRYWALAGQAQHASLRATYYGGSGVYGADGRQLATVESEQGIAIADVPDRAGAGREGHAPAIAAPRLPGEYRRLDRMLRPVTEICYRRGLKR